MMDVSELGVVEMLSGRVVDLRSPNPATLHEDDYALGLARMPRYFGQIEKNFSIAEHCFFLSMVVGDDPSTCLSALVDDVSEAYLGDLIAPLVEMPELTPYRKMHRHFSIAVRQSVGISVSVPRIIQQRDEELRIVERVHLRGYEPRKDEVVLPVKFGFWDAKEAEKMFLARFYELRELIAKQEEEKAA